jgi:diguanylate cyclase (GGDEF)-like protein
VGASAERTRKLPTFTRVGPSRKVVVPTLRVVAGRDMLRFVTLAPGETVAIGRDEGTELILSDSSVSRRHAKVVCGQDGGLMVYDLGSTNGTAVNGQAIERSPFRPGDHLEVGAVSLRLDLLSLEEVAHLATVVARLESASRDPLTGLLTRAWLEDELPGLLARCDRTGAPLSTLFLDVDHFKAVNDQHGHAVGDEALLAVARLVMVCVRDGDPCVRYGGEELVVFLEGTAEPDATDVAERIRRVVAGHDWGRTAPGLRITVSLGIAERRPGEAWREWVDRADRALYAAKTAGRNRVQRAGAP